MCHFQAFHFEMNFFNDLSIFGLSNKKYDIELMSNQNYKFSWSIFCCIYLAEGSKKW
jgi:hypothetical protein